MQITKAKSTLKTFAINSFKEFKDVILKMPRGGSKKPIRVIIYNEKISEADIDTFFEKEIKEVYPEIEEFKEFDYEEVRMLIDSCELALEEYRVTYTETNTIIIFKWYLDN